MKTFKAVLLLGFLFLVQPASAQFSVVDAVTTNRSATIVTGGTFQTILAKATYRSITIQNNNATDNCWITFGTLSGTIITAGNASKASAIKLTPTQAFTRYFPYVPYDEIEATCDNTSDTIYVDTQ